MKLITNKSNAQGKQLICEDAIFDPMLLSLLGVDIKENYFVAGYDYSECGNPLNLPFEIEEAEFHIRITPCDVHIGLVATIPEGIKSNYANEVGEVEFNARLNAQEKATFLCSIFSELFSLASEDEETKNEDKQVNEVQGDKDATIPKSLDNINKEQLGAMIVNLLKNENMKK